MAKDKNTVQKRLQKIEADVARLREHCCLHERIVVEIDSDGWVSSARCDACGIKLRRANGYSRKWSTKRIYKWLTKKTLP